MAAQTQFTTIPTLPLSAALSPETKPKFLVDLRDALLNVGFLYLSETGIPDELIQDVIRETSDFFETLPQEEKERIEMKNEKSFLGWSRLDNETTAHLPDHREQLDLSTPHELPGPTSPLYHHLHGPNQWPSANHLPKFRPIFEEYMQRMTHISTLFTSLIAEAIGLPANAFDRFFDVDQQHKLKIVKYPEVDVSSLPGDASAAAIAAARQGVGPHKDSMLTSYLLQASPQRGLQAQNQAGEWIDAVPVSGTLVVAIGQGMEALTGGVCASTTHRVLSPGAGEGPRYSVPFFQGVSYDARFEEMNVPDEMRAMADEVRRRRGGRRDDVEFTFVKGRWGHLGEATLMNRVKSHPDVGERWVVVGHNARLDIRQANYPELLAQIRAQQAAEAQAKSVTVNA